MKKKSKKILILGMCSFMLVGALAGCKGKEEKNDSKEPDVVENTELEESETNDFAVEDFDIEEIKKEILALEYDNLEEEHILTELDAYETIDFLSNGTGALLLSFPECPWCQEYIPMVNDIAKEMGLEDVKYFNIKGDRSEETDEYKKILEVINANVEEGNDSVFVRKNEEGNDRIFVPELVLVDNGKVFYVNDETSMVSSEETPVDEYWTEEKVTAFKKELCTNMKRFCKNETFCSECNE